MAHEAVGYGTWVKGTDLVPATEAGELLAQLDITNVEHPVLQSLPNHNSTSDTAQSTDGAAEPTLEENKIPQTVEPLGRPSGSEREPDRSMLNVSSQTPDTEEQAHINDGVSREPGHTEQEPVEDQITEPIRATRADSPTTQ
ncbi:hypothetical protein DL765_001266 [Monosporascus sp. GIB2]|nr:hypothetical protein DL765_001266 [Monosporascus sp. GIB2]